MHEYLKADLFDRDLVGQNEDFSEQLKWNTLLSFQKMPPTFVKYLLTHAAEDFL